jgi:ribonuclease P protein component
LRPNFSPRLCIKNLSQDNATPHCALSFLPDCQLPVSTHLAAEQFQLGSGVQRLKTRPQFQAALSGSTVSRTPHFALHRLSLPDHTGPASSFQANDAMASLFHPKTVWLGAMVPKRWARRAVTRNAIKRQIYAVSAQFEVRMPCAAHVVRLRAGFDRKQYISATSTLLKQAVRLELEQLFERAAQAT